MYAKLPKLEFEITDAIEASNVTATTLNIKTDFVAPNELKAILPINISGQISKPIFIIPEALHFER